ncbi:alpha/beta fold hydrolase [Paenibacillus paridis]|uniref:alpha/beta fold hydrolase n=1 Tax=Paenibacillus paridis TaxID=2583376 RepID=UPI00111E36C3|nr:alpha/beta hydrolase [Paenibacillus paridis]
MKMESYWAVNQDINIHYIDTKSLADLSLTPLIICPGLSETAEEYEDLLLFLLPRRAIVLSFRGRGSSDTPMRGYDLKEHITDISAVVEHSKLERFHLMGNSRGVSYALGYAQTNEERLDSLIVEDYPAEHKQMPTGWAADYLSNYIIPTNRTANIRVEAVEGIQRESSAVFFNANLMLPVLVMRGLLEGSLINDQDLCQYTSLMPNVTIASFEQSAHNIRYKEQGKLYQTISQFLAQIDQEKG